MTNSLAIIAFAALIHASFQLSVSVLTLLSGHAIGKKTSHHRVLRLTSSFAFGVAVMTMLLISFSGLIFTTVFNTSIPPIAWAIVCGLLFGLGIAVWSFYYRREKGTSLWLPRGMARYLGERAKATSHSSESFGLGLSSVVAELLFIIAPIAVASLVLVPLEPMWQLAGIAIYTVISMLSLLIVNGLVGGGKKLSHIQKWREDNKRFLQFAAGSGLIVLGFYLYVDKILGVLHGGS